jgi:hypothetical protein
MVDAAGNIIISNSFSGNGFATFGEDINGELYVAGINSGTIFKIIDTTLSNPDFDYSNISVIKNSTRGLFTILNATNINFFQIFDVTGKQMFSSYGNNNDEQILDLRSFSNGIYFIKMELNTGLTYQTKIYLN